MQHTPSRFLIKVAKPVSRFLTAHPALSRFVSHIPGASRFLTWPIAAAVPHIAPVYNTRARKQRHITLRM
jgi:hypothetical protein